MVKREVDAMVADVNFYPGVWGYMRTILCHHVVALLMSQDVSRYPKERVHWSNMESEEIKREGEFQRQWCEASFN